jgi:hypothetical protein
LIEHVVVVVQRESKLPQVILALRAASGLSGGLHGRQEQCHKHPDNRNHDQQFDERKRTPPGPLHVSAPQKRRSESSQSAKCFRASSAARPTPSCKSNQLMAQAVQLSP